MKFLKTISPFLLSLIATLSNSQTTDPHNLDKWINYNNRDSYLNFSTPNKWTKSYITDSQDTLTREFEYTYRTNFGVTFCESNLVNGKKNGLTILYHPNGQIYCIWYFLDGKIWESISLCDSFGRKYNPGTLKDGTGTLSYISNDGIYLGYRTYLNGNLNGKYVQINGAKGPSLEGEVKYFPECISYNSLTAVTYKSNNDTLANLFSDNNYKLFIENNKNITVLNSKKLYIVNQYEYGHDMDLSFDPGEIPIGVWRLTDVETKRPLIEYQYDNWGNKISITYYAEDGSVSKTLHF